MNIDGFDKKLIKSHNIRIETRVIIADRKNENNVLAEFSGTLINDDYSIDTESDIRRSYNLEIALTSWSLGDNFDITEGLQEWDWYNAIVKPSVTFYFFYDGEIINKTYNMGKFLFDNRSYSWDAQSATVTLGCLDLMCLFTGDRNGELSGLGTTIEAANPTNKLGNANSIKSMEKEVIGADKSETTGIKTGEVLKHPNTIIGAMTSVLEQFGGLTSSQYDLTDPADVENAEQYIPYDLEFGVSSTIYDIISSLRDLNTGWETFFDENGMFIFQPMPSSDGEDTDPVIEDEDILDLLISDNTQTDMKEIKNCIEVWGKTWDTARTADEYDAGLGNDTKQTAITSGQTRYGLYSFYCSLVCSQDTLTMNNNSKRFQNEATILLTVPELFNGSDADYADSLTDQRIDIYSKDGTGYTKFNSSPISIAIYDDQGNLTTALPAGIFKHDQSYIFSYSFDDNVFVYVGEPQIGAVAKVFSNEQYAQAVAARDAVEVSKNKNYYGIYKSGVYFRGRNSGMGYVAWYADSIELYPNYAGGRLYGNNNRHFDILVGIGTVNNETHYYTVGIPAILEESWYNQLLENIEWDDEAQMVSRTTSQPPVGAVFIGPVLGDKIKIKYKGNGIDIYLNDAFVMHDSIPNWITEKVLGFASTVSTSRTLTYQGYGTVTVDCGTTGEPTSTIGYIVDENCPYGIDKIGEVRKVLSGDEYDPIYSNRLALQRAKYEAWKYTQGKETVSVRMVAIPWLDVRQIVEYRGTKYQVKAIKRSFSDGTMTVDMIRWYPTYPWQ